MGGVVVMYSPTVGMARLFQGVFFEDLKRPPPPKGRGFGSIFKLGKESVESSAKSRW